MCVQPADEPVVLNVNFPAEVSQPRAMLTRVGRRAYPRSGKVAWPEEESTRPFYLFGAPDEEIPYNGAEWGTDIAALRAGLISVTVVPVAWSPGKLTQREQQFLEGLKSHLAPPHGFDITSHFTQDPSRD
jgi:broad specificity polyphosphatase/5'/3'-nucleotidase SurE